MNDDQKNKLQDLRQKVLTDLVGMKDHLTDNQNANYETLLTLARVTGDTSLLEQTYKKATEIEDPTEKINALLEVLEEVELSLVSPSQQAAETPPQDIPEAQ